jgi:phosphatidylglycerophosphate synthase
MLNDPSVSAILLAPDADGLRPVYRMPAVRRLVILLRRAGIRRIHIIGCTGPFVPVLSDLLAAEFFHPVEESTSLEKLLKGPPFDANGVFLAMRGDLVLDGDSVQNIAMEAGKGQPLFMPGESGVRADGLYAAGSKDIVQVLQTLWSPESYPFPPVSGHRMIQGPPGLPCRAGAEAQAGSCPEAGLVRSLGRQTEADDGFMARHVDRRISRFFSSRLAHTVISPNQITIAGMTIGLAGAFFLSLPGYWAEVFGALLFVFCVVVDGVDGEVARLKLMETPFGHTLDIVTDNIVNVAVFLCIAVGLYRHTGNPLYMHALLFLMGGFALAAVAVYCCILKRSPGEIRQSSRSFRVMALMANRDFAYLVLLFAAFHRIDWFLLAASAGTYLFAALLFVLRLVEFRPAAERG